MVATTSARTSSAPLICYLFALIPLSLGFSANIDRIRSAVLDAPNKADATTLPQLREGLLLPLVDRSAVTLTYASDFIPRQRISIPDYDECTRSRHEDCENLFDGYGTSILRCEALDETSLNVRWEATWIPPGSTWLYNLADAAGWNVTRKSADPANVSAFSWKSVFGLFSTAFATGNITLPISSVEGNTLISIEEESSEESAIIQRISLTESIDLVREADASRLQNRRVAQEFASWLDVSRRPPDECSIDAEEWAGTVQSRILTGVPGAGALDVDPNEDDGEGVLALVLFGAISLAAIALSYEYFIVPEVVGGTGQVSRECDDALILEFGSGYLSECFGPYGEGPFVR